MGRAEPRPSERGVWQREDSYRQRGYEQQQPSYVPWGGPGPRPAGPSMHGPVPLGGPALDVVPGETPYIPDTPFLPDVEHYGWMGGPGRGGPGSAAMKRNACRIFVGGVPDVLSEEDLKLHFEK